VRVLLLYCHFADSCFVYYLSNVFSLYADEPGCVCSTGSPDLPGPRGVTGPGSALSDPGGPGYDWSPERRCCCLRGAPNTEVSGLRSLITTSIFDLKVIYGVGQKVSC